MEGGEMVVAAVVMGEGYIREKRVIWCDD